MEYTLQELREMLNYMHTEIKDLAPCVDPRLLSRRASVAQAVENIENSERLHRELESCRTKGGAAWLSI